MSRGRDPYKCACCDRYRTGHIFCTQCGLAFRKADAAGLTHMQSELIIWVANRVRSMQKREGRS